MSLRLHLRTRTGHILACVLAFFFIAMAPESQSRASSFDSPVITAIRIEMKGGFSDAETLETMARDLLLLQEGDSFSPDELEGSLRALRLSRRFSHIHVDSLEDKQVFELLFQLTPAPLVRDIRMKGIYPFFERDIRQVMTLSPGDSVTPADLEEQRELVEEFFQREGFINPRAVFEAEGDPRDGFLSIELTLTRGPFYRLGRFDVQGASHFGESQLQRMSAVYRNRILPGVAGRFLEKRLEDDLKQMRRRYREAGLADSLITAEILRHPDQGRVDVDITIDEGPLYRIDFSGNRAFRHSALEEELLFLQLGNRNNVALNRSTRAIVQKYRNAGYPDMTLTVDDEIINEEEGAIRSITFHIHEGAYHGIGSFAIQGISAFPERTVRGWIDLSAGRPFVDQRLDQALLTIESALRAIGYLDVATEANVSWSEEDDQRMADITIVVQEGVQTRVSSLRFTGFESISEEDARRITDLSEGDALVARTLERDRRELAAALSERGHPHVTVREYRTFSDDRSKVDIEFRADEGPRVVVGNVYLRGNFRTKDRILLRQLQLRPGEPFSASRYLQGERNIRNLDILESARFRAPGLAEQAEEVTILVDVAEKKPYFVEAGFGYETERGLYADAKAGDRNLFGTNRSGWIASSISETGYRNEVAATDPRFLGYSLSATASLYQERLELFNQPFGTDTYGASLKFSRKLAPNLGAGLGFRFEQKELFLREGPVPPGSEDLYLARSIVVASPSLSYDSRDFFLRPRSGLYSVLSVDVSKGMRNSFDDFLKYSLDVRYFYTPLSRLTLAVLGRGAFLQTYGPGIIPEDQLLFLGGTSSVRGFSENMLRYDERQKPLGGRQTLAGSLEARIDLGRNWELATFFDTGSVSRTFDDIGTDGFRSSVGAGLRYITPIGPMGILYGAKLDRREGEGSGRWHFSIGYTF